VNTKAYTGQEQQAVLADQNPSIIPLGRGGKGLRGIVVGVGNDAPDAILTPEEDELKRRLLEIGFVEGALVEIIHEGWIGHDPIAVRLDDMRVALRRREADNVLIRPIVTAGAR
jgi:ferrous iron transport protein A